MSLKLGVMMGYWQAQPPPNLLELAVAAEKVGCDAIFSAEAWGSDAFTPLAYIAAHTERIRLGFGVTLTPFGFTHPARIAEKVAAVDILSNGRVEWGTGRSTPMEQTAFHVDREKSRDDWREAIEIVCKMWSQERFSWDSPR